MKAVLEFDLRTEKFQFMRAVNGLSWSQIVYDVDETFRRELKHNEDLEVLSKRQRKDIKEWVWRSLLKRAIPQSNTYDMVWNTETSMLYFGSTGTKICDEFSEHFLKTFELDLSSLFPYSLAYQMLEDEEINPELLDDLRESSFAKVVE